MTHVSQDAVIYCKYVSQNASQQLMGNYNTMRTGVDEALAQWNDPHVKKYLELSELMSEVVLEVVKRLGIIDQFCDQELFWINSYLNA